MYTKIFYRGRGRYRGRGVLSQPKNGPIFNTIEISIWLSGKIFYNFKKILWNFYAKFNFFILGRPRESSDWWKFRNKIGCYFYNFSLYSFFHFEKNFDTEKFERSKFWPTVRKLDKNRTRIENPKKNSEFLGPTRWIETDFPLLTAAKKTLVKLFFTGAAGGTERVINRSSILWLWGVLDRT